MTNDNDKPITTQSLINQPHVTFHVILDSDLTTNIQEALTTQVIINNSQSNSETRKDAERHMRYLREEVGMRVVWQFADALGYRR